jgi:hypothetical protein
MTDELTQEHIIEIEDKLINVGSLLKQFDSKIDEFWRNKNEKTIN